MVICMSSLPRQTSGFTLIELLVVLAILATLAALVVPVYINRADDARDVVLKQNLQGLREAIDLYYRDRRTYPSSLEQLVAERYVRQVPVDPITERSDTWRLIPPKPDRTDQVFDVKSGAKGKAKDGSDYASW
jgi:general secretion pathway protein G